MDKIKIKLNAELGGFPIGRELVISVDSVGNPLDGFWRGRLKDSVIDNCIEIVEDKPITRVKRTRKLEEDKNIETQ